VSTLFAVVLVVLEEETALRIAAKLLGGEHLHPIFERAVQPRRDACMAILEGPRQVLDLNDLSDKCSAGVVLSIEGHPACRER
jgi:hypothetical protein